jgi:hypothetical protein
LLVEKKECEFLNGLLLLLLLLHLARVSRTSSAGYSQLTAKVEQAQEVGLFSEHLLQLAEVTLTSEVEWSQRTENVRMVLFVGLLLLFPILMKARRLVNVRRRDGS